MVDDKRCQTLGAWLIIQNDNLVSQCVAFTHFELVIPAVGRYKFIKL